MPAWLNPLPAPTHALRGMPVKKVIHREEAEAYGRLKERLAEEYPYDIEGYCDGKDEFVKELERRALAWALDR